MNFIQTAKIFVFVIVLVFSPVSSSKEWKNKHVNNNTTVYIRKCCNMNYILENSASIFDNYNNLLVPVFKNVNETKENLLKVNFVYNCTNCVNNKKDFITVQPEISSDEADFAQSNGKLRITTKNTSFDCHEYCPENYEEGILGILCSAGYLKNCKFDDGNLQLTVIGTIISLPFFLVTFVVYALLPKRKLHGLCLMCYVFALFWVYFIACFIYFFIKVETPNYSACRIIMALVYFFIMASFFWTNVMSFDIWLTFRGTQSISGSRRRTEWKRFLIYSSYAWGIPVLLLLLIFSLSCTAPADAWYNPGAINQECFIKEGIPRLLYYYGPVAIIITVNIILVAMIAWKIRQIQKLTAVLRKGESARHRSGKEDKQRFKLYLKLLFAMGINWSMEVVPWAVGMLGGNVPLAVFCLSDFCTAAFGMFIFFIFVFKKTVWNSLKKGYCTTSGVRQEADLLNNTETQNSTKKQQASTAEV